VGERDRDEILAARHDDRAGSEEDQREGPDELGDRGLPDVVHVSPLG
jgi:hypothetical protein